ncbi:MAG: MFS transporter [bacterium]|nr:MFS transporter [bacterium]
MPAKGSPLFIGTLLFLLNFLVMTDYLAMVPLVMDIAHSTGLAGDHTGFLLSTYPIAAAFSSFFSAPFSDRLGRKRTLLLLLAGFSLASVGVALSSSVWQIFLFRFLSGVFGGPVLPNSFAYCGDAFKGPARAKLITNLALSFSAASILGVPLGAVFGDWFGWQGVFLVIALGALVGFVAFLFLKEIPTEATGTVTEQYGGLLGLWKHLPVRRAFYLQFVMMLGLFGVVPNLAVWLSTNYHYSAQGIGFAYMQGGIGAVLGNRLASFLLERGLMRRGLITMGSLVMAFFLGLACFELLEAPPFGFLIAGMMFGGSMRVPAHQLNLSELLPIHLRGRLMSMNMIVSHLAMGAGGFWSSPLLELHQGKLEGMPLIGLLAVLSLLCVPYLVVIFQRAAVRQTETY